MRHRLAAMLLAVRRPGRRADRRPGDPSRRDARARRVSGRRSARGPRRGNARLRHRRALRRQPVRRFRAEARQRRQLVSGRVVPEGADRSRQTRRHRDRRGRLRQWRRRRDRARRAVPGPAADGGAVFVGYGLDAPRQGFDDYRGLDVRGKFVVMLPGVPEGTPSEVGRQPGSEKATNGGGAWRDRRADHADARSCSAVPVGARARQIGTPRQRVVEPDRPARARRAGDQGQRLLHGAAADALFAGSGTTAGGDVRRRRGKGGGRGRRAEAADPSSRSRASSRRRRAPTSSACCRAATRRCATNMSC